MPAPAPVTVTATKVGSLKSIVRNQAYDGSTTTQLTINHGLGKTPHVVIPTVRTLVTSPSGDAPALVVSSFDATKVVLIAAAGPTHSVLVDVIISFEHSLVQ